MFQRKSFFVWLLVLTFMLGTVGLASAADLQGTAKITLDNSSFSWGQPLTGKINWACNVAGKTFNLSKAFTIPFPTTDINNLIKKYLPTTTNTTPTTPTTPTTTNTNPSNFALTADEQQMLDLVNKERTSQGLSPLKVNPTLTQVARAHSKDMIQNNYFAHNSLDGKTPFDRMKAAGITYKTAGENIAGNSSVQGAHTSLMNSPGHRANILNANFTEVGIGIVDGGQYGKMFTQDFMGQ